MTNGVRSDLLANPESAKVNRLLLLLLKSIGRIAASCRVICG
jgi:hypothetical protein